MVFNQTKSASAKCFRYKSQKVRFWDSSVAYNYLPVCYESRCVQDPTKPLGWVIEVTIGDNTVICETQGQEITGFGNLDGDSLFCPVRFDVFCGPHSHEVFVL